LKHGAFSSTDFKNNDDFGHLMQGQMRGRRVANMVKRPGVTLFFCPQRRPSGGMLLVPDGINDPVLAYFLGDVTSN
jgi:hypothetical protein